MASSTIAPSAVVLELLNMDNYEYWSRCVKIYLLGEGLWQVVEDSGDPPRQEDDKEKFDVWSRQNAKALHVILISCGSGIFPLIGDSTSARVAWDMLARKFTSDFYYTDERSDFPTVVDCGRQDENVEIKEEEEEEEATNAGHENNGANVALQEAFHGLFDNIDVGWGDIGYVWYGCSLRKSWLLLISENKWLKSKAAECLVNWLFISAVSGKSSGKVFGKLKTGLRFLFVE